MSVEQPVIYRIIFTQEDKIYEIYARYVSEDSMVGFIDAEELLFSTSTHLVSENNANSTTPPAITPPGTNTADLPEAILQAEFQGVKRTYIPLHQILRIDEMTQHDAMKIKAHYTSTGNVHHLQNYRQKNES